MIQSQVIATPSYVPTRCVFGESLAQSVPELAVALDDTLAAPRALLVCGRRSVPKPGLDQLLDQASAFCAVTLEKQDDYPTIDGVTAMLHEARRGAVNLVIAVGGGSVIDTAKAIALLLNQPFDLDAALSRSEFPRPSLPLIAVPTTAGTGSEATRFATIWDMRRKRKYSISCPYPRLALIDPLLPGSTPWTDKVSCALDAVCQAIEGCWSRNSTEESIGCGLEALSLLLQGLERLLADANDRSAYPLLAKGSLYSGMSIAQGRTTIAHAISYPLTARYGIRHGHACALTIGALLRFNAAVTESDCLDPRGRSHVRSVIARICSALRVRDAGEGETRMADLLRSCGLKSFADIDEIEIDLLVQDVMSYDRFENNPRAMGRAALTTMLRGLKLQACVAAE